MKKHLLFFLMICWIVLSMGQPVDKSYQSDLDKVNMLEQKIVNLENRSDSFDVQLQKLNAKIILLIEKDELLSRDIIQKQQSIDSLAKIVARNSENIKNTADSLGIKIRTTDETVAQNSNLLKSKTIWGLISVVITLLVSVIVALLLHKKGQKTSDDKIALLKKQADELNEKIVHQFSNEMGELQKIGDVLKNTGANTSAEPDHSLVKTLADRITFMEMTLYRMDSSVKGHKQLSKSIAQMKDNLLANGYEIVDMLGREYDEGMKVTANFIEDENIEAGKQIITSIVKPQINYKGVMIQSAQITVSQN